MEQALIELHKQLLGLAKDNVDVRKDSDSPFRKGMTHAYDDAFQYAAMKLQNILDTHGTSTD